MKILSCFTLAIISISIPFPLSAQSATDQRPVFYEAESIPGKYTDVDMDEGASGGMYIKAFHNDRYSLLVSLKLPHEMSQVTVWARIRGCSQVLKTDLGKPVELKWQHRVSDVWEWRNFGTYNRSDLGESIRIVRAPGGEGGVDALFLDPTGVIDPRKLKDFDGYKIK